MAEKKTGGHPVAKSDEEWRKTLSPEQYRVLRERGGFAGIGNCSRVIHEYRRGDERNAENGERDESQAGPEGVHGTSPLCTSVGAVCGGVNALRHAPCGDFRVLRG